MNIIDDRLKDTSTGLHMIGDLYKCDLSLFAELSEKDIEKSISEIIEKCNLNALGSYIHLFEEGGFTTIFALAESHISIHTWPEINYVSLDVFVCNYSRDNSQNAKKLYYMICRLFKPRKNSSKIITRKLHEN